MSSTEAKLESAHSLVLTPTKRKRRPKLSGSPQKDTSPPKKARTWSETGASKPAISAVPDMIDGGELVFSDGYVTWEEEEKTWGFPSLKYMAVVSNYLDAHFQTEELMVMPPFISIQMAPGEPIPDANERPFRIADLLCLWRTSDEPVPQPHPAFNGFGSGESITLPDGIARTIELSKTPFSIACLDVVLTRSCRQVSSQVNHGVPRRDILSRCVGDFVFPQHHYCRAARHRAASR
jgi:hypothetical protein